MSQDNKENVATAGDEEKDVGFTFASDAPSGSTQNAPLSSAFASAASVAAKKGWPDQKLDEIKVGELTPLSPVVMHRQATINIGTIGHVAHGKCWGKGVKLLMHDGSSKAVEEIVAGDRLMGDDSTARIVQSKSLVHESGSMFRITSENRGRDVWTCNDKHVLVLRIHRRPRAVKVNGRWHITQLRLVNGDDNDSQIPIEELLSHVSFSSSEEAEAFASSLSFQPLVFECTVQDYMTNISDSLKHELKMYQPDVLTFTKPTNSLKSSMKSTYRRTISKDTLLKTAWVIGAWLSIGCATYPSIEQIRADCLSKLKSWCAEMNGNTGRNAFATKSVGVDLGLSFKNLLDHYSLTNNKHIPLSLLTESVAVRRALLSGLIDGNGSFNGSILGITVSGKALRDSVLHLCRGLGFNVTKIAGDKISIVGNTDDWLKLSMAQSFPTQAKLNFVHDSGFTVEDIGVGEYFGFQVDGNGRLLMNDFVVTHNSTVVKAISGVQTVRFKTELERNITIKLGYANAKIYKCNNEKCVRPGNYRSYGSAKEAEPMCERPGCGGRMILQRHVSFVDCPGHDILMATMLNGAAVMDAALLLIAGNEPCPQPQTSEHLAAIEIMKLKHLIILQNKIDLVKEKEAASQYDEILHFIRGTIAVGSPIIPISAQLKYNIDVICEYICNKIPVPVRDFTSSPQLIVIRSFDVNKPGEEVDALKGGVAGGSILKGVLRIGHEIEIRPGIVTKDKSGNVRCLPIKSRIVSLYAEHNDLEFAVPGGLIGVGTRIDPTLTRADRLVGQVLGDVGTLPDIFTELEISFFLLRRLLGVKTDGHDKKKHGKIKNLAKGEILMVNIGSTSTGARILQVKGDLAKVVLTSPVCTSEGEKLALSRRVEKHWRLIGWGQIRKGTRIIQSDSTASSMVGIESLGLGIGVSVNEDGEAEEIDEKDDMDRLNEEADQAAEEEDDEDSS